MKNSTIFFLFWPGIAGFAVCRADTSPSEKAACQATITADGLQHVQIDGGNYFFKPDHIIVKVDVPVELSVSAEKGLIPRTPAIQSREKGMEGVLEVVQ